jgi:predicted RecB family nuclease
MTAVETESSEVVPASLQGGYLAKQCPEAVQLDVLRPVDPLPTSQFRMMLAAAGNAFERTVFAELLSSVSGAVEVDRTREPNCREALTTEAMRAGAQLVIGGRLPVDAVGHRVGEPDLLVRAGDEPKVNGRWAYVPVDVKHHIVRDTPELPGNPAESLGVAPWVETGGAAASEFARWTYGDLVQLAHYQRLLEACGHEISEGRWGGIIGVGQQLAWYDLDAPCWAPSEYLEERPAGPLSTMESYDAAFAHRLTVIDAALRQRRDPAVPLLAEPILVPACAECGWRVWCYPRLEEAGDLSLLPGVDMRKRRLHQERRVTELHGLAGLDDRTARLVAAGVQLADLIERAAAVEPRTSIGEVIPRRHRQIATLAREGVRNVDDLKGLSGQTLRYENSGIGDLPGQIDRARARLGPEPAYRRRGVDRLGVPRADIEIDIDMENVEQGTYLWGVLFTERRPSGPPAVEYLPFVSWDPETSTGELDAFERFWEWLRGQRAAAAASDRLLRAYCYSKSAENSQMRRIAGRLGLEEEVKAFLASEQWVDLYAVFRDQLVTGTTMGLKTVAQLAGFRWRSEDAGGGQAMVRYAEAVSDPNVTIRVEARRWLLEYNEDDVRATVALREWLDVDARPLPSVETLGNATAT